MPPRLGLAGRPIELEDTAARGILEDHPDQEGVALVETEGVASGVQVVAGKVVPEPSARLDRLQFEEDGIVHPGGEGGTRREIAFVRHHGAVFGDSATGVMWPTSNEAGQELLHKYILPLIARNGARLELPEKGDDRRRMGKSINRSNVIILDVSVEEGHIYHKYNELPKVLNHMLLCSRTPLPRNVYSLYQIAPTYGHTLTNHQIADWLEELFPEVLQRNRSMSLGQRIFGKYWQMRKDLNDQEALRQEQIGNFITYRGTQSERADGLAARLREQAKRPVTLIQPRELATDAECMTKQRMWEVVIRLMDRIHYAQTIYIYLSEDYFDSFWTRSEVLAVAYTRREWKSSRLKTLLVRDPNEDLRELADFDELGVPTLTDKQIWRLARITSNSDPGSMGPDAVSVIRERSEGPLGELPYFKDTIWTERWWKDVMVPCPLCKPGNSRPNEINWDNHLAIEKLWYFPIQKEILKGGSVMVYCPSCGKQLNLQKLASPRTLWVPGPRGKPWPDELQVIAYEDVWEARLAN